MSVEKEGPLNGSGKAAEPVVEKDSYQQFVDQLDLSQEVYEKHKEVIQNCFKTLAEVIDLQGRIPEKTHAASMLTWFGHRLVQLNNRTALQLFELGKAKLVLSHLEKVLAESPEPPAKED